MIATVAERDAMANGILPVATDLVCQVHDWDAAEIRKTLNGFGEGGLRALCVVLASMVPDDQPLDDLIAWTHEEPRKPCSRCRRVKPIGQFPRNRAQADGRNRWCRDCLSEARRKAPVQLPIPADGQRKAS